MPATTENPPEAPSLEQELEELQRDEKRFEQRLQKSQIATLVASIVAFVVAATALGVALANKSDNTTVVTRGGQAAVGQGAVHRATGAAQAVATSRTVKAELGEMFVRPNATSISAGKVTFVAHNGGKVVHELMVERTPLKMDGPGRPNEKAALGMIEDLDPGASGKVTLNLKPGTYQLWCNVPGHYAAGQHTTFTVTKS